ncbi:LytR/AlgR family response regulator transcription factor [Desulfosporosinus meridiei]|uniref:Stage 0 sporulation protein A homolog n=1 Tax=Desulfosporosinus meridiei (strain ATCC BAA-275 / DSM 13257 / KCTC 12902 / NCIMB 13706 / S10) TaxID=768704 RepID=J7INF3_DESMD|nr:LytTR family DNA-binding domain-containing protein [Desulfosporosinus meridiei]AFQ43327.1 response regulator of the LytR/AlgR family [Desulfosporosinus meridiei DSM 13257]
MLHIAICDDNYNELLQINQIVEEFRASHSSKYNIKCDIFSSSLDLLAATENRKSYDLLILDVVMPLMTGIEVATEIRQKSNLSKIIFLTSSREFAVDSYKVDAFYYLLKPISKEELMPILEKACTEIADEKEKGILVKCKTCLTKILLHNLEYTEVLGRTLFFHLTTGEVLESYGTMSQLENDLLRDKRFIKPHRSYIVNMDSIHRITDKDIITFSNKPIPVSRELYKTIKQAYIDYSFEG